jgi:hypothetical protein
MNNRFINRLTQDPVGKLLTEAGSFYGHSRGKLVAHKNLQEINKAHSSLNGKKILILGTGPSSAALTKSQIDQFDHIILLNLAIKYVPILLAFGKTVNKLHFFCTDRNRILKAGPWLKLHQLPKQNCIFFPDYPYSVFRLDLHRIPSILLCGLKKYRKAYIDDDPNATRGWHYLYTNTPINEKQIMQEYINYMHQRGSPILLPYSVVFSAITFYSFFRPSLIHMLGCDFSGPYFSLEPMDETFQFVRSLLASFDIPLENLSTAQLKMIRGER